MKRTSTLLSIFLLSIAGVKAQENDDKAVSAFIQVQAIGTSGGQVPFWMRTNNYGSNPLDGISGSLIGGIRKHFETDTVSWFHKKVEWEAGVEARLNAGNKVRGQLIAGFIRARYRIFQIGAGRSKDRMGFADSLLSSGAFAVSGNAPGIPKVEISIPRYWTLPVLDGLISIKGNFALGYVGTMDMVPANYNFTDQATAYYHQKSFYGRLGKENWKLKLYGGFNHEVMWGQEAKYLGPEYTPGSLTTLWYVISGKAYSSASLPRSKVGNHIGSLDQGLSYDFSGMQLKMYHEFFYDVGGLAHFNNIKDGLWGLSFSNTQEPDGRGLYWKKFLLEFLCSKSQGGELTAKVTPSGDENYYNNYVYYEGWAYKHETIGNNFLTNKQYQRKELPQYDKEYFGNNRVILGHVGVEWQLDEWSIVNKFSYSRNYGTYATSPIGNTTGSVRSVQPPPYFYPVSQFSGYIEASRPLKNNFNIGFVLAGDYGDLLYNSIGGMVKLTKTW